MGDGYTVDIAQLRQHADNLDSLTSRFTAVTSASTHITQDDKAYGLLCGWISAILEGRHKKQDDLVAFVEENLNLAAQEVRGSASDYERSDGNAGKAMQDIRGDLSGGDK